ncbi:hypothetical protein AgCh_011663 [Apium graveolens]
MLWQQKERDTSYDDSSSNKTTTDSTSYSTYDSLNKPTDVKDGNNDAVRNSLDLSDDSSHDRPNSSGGSSTAQERPTISDIDLSESWSSSSDSEKNSSCRGKDPITCSNSSYDSETNAPDDSTDTTHGEASPATRPKNQLFF